MMQEFLTYNARVAVCIAAFYLFYKLLLSRETFHRLNRAVIVGVTLLSFVLPVWRVTRYRYVAVGPMVFDDAHSAGIAAVAEHGFDWWAVAGAVFVAGAAAVLLHTAAGVMAVRRILREGRHERLDRQAVLVRLERDVAPFSWIRWIVAGERDLAENGDTIIAHERAHIRLRHSYDLLVTDLLAVMQWFNPAMWLLRAELRAVHEYEADAAVLAGGADVRAYQMLLIEKAAGGRWYSIANSLNHSKLKNRITMMLRKKSSRLATARVLFVVPLACIAAAAFARTVVVPVEGKVTENFSIGEIAADKPQTDEAPQAQQEEASDKKIVVRYTGNVSYTNAKVPVWIVDGREVTEQEAKTISADDIDHLTVIKDDTAVKFYGERARNGVIQIITKKFQQDIDRRVKELNENLSSIDSEELYRRVKELNENLSSIDSEELYRRVKELNENLSSIDSEELCRRAKELNENQPSIDVEEWNRRVKELDEKLSAVVWDKHVEVSGNVSIVNSDEKPVEYYIDGKKVAKEEFRAMPSDRIANMNIDKFEDHTRIDITTKK